MKICIKSANRNTHFTLPTGLIFNKTTAKLINTFGRAYAGNSLRHISAEDLERLWVELGRIKKKYEKWELVQIESANGENVEVIL